MDWESERAAALPEELALDRDDGDDEELPGLVKRTGDAINSQLEPTNVLYSGLVLLGWDEARLRRRKKDETNIDQYRSMYGVDPIVTSQMCGDLLNTDIVDARVTEEEFDLDKVHWALHFMYRYPKEKEAESLWKKTANTFRASNWFYIARIRALKAAKITWPDYYTEDDIFVMTVDGTHLLTLEPGDSDIPKDPSYFSFKHHAAGYNYEVGICLFRNRVIWLKGPFRAGAYNDAKMFRVGGLRDKLKETGKKGIGDDGYRGFPNEISTANGLDSEAVREWKVRARQRHETYNSKLKVFCILSDRFRCKNHPHDTLTPDQKLQMCFEAVNVIVQYKMDNGSTLFDV